MDQIISVPAPAGTAAIWSWHVPFKPRCVKVVTFLFVYLQKVLVNISTAPFGGNFMVFKWLLVFNPSLALTWEATENCFHFWHLKQEQSTSGFDFFWQHSRNSIARGVLQRNTRRQNHHYIMPWSGCLGPGKLARNTVFVIRDGLRPLELHWFFDWQGWHRCASSKNLNPKRNYSQSGL